MLHHRLVPARRRWARLAALAVAAAALAAPLVAPIPAGAVPAPLLTDKGLGIRVNETAITAAVLADIDDIVTPLVDAHMYDGAVNHTGISSFDWVVPTYDLDLAVDFHTPGVGAPNGKLSLQADITDARFEYYRYGQWWEPECFFWVDLDPVSVDTQAAVTTGALPGNPLVAGSASSNWAANTPYESVSSFLCYGHILFPFDWTGFSDLTNPLSPASLIDAEVDLALADLVDRIWDDNVQAPMTSLTTLGGFDVDVDQVRTDDNGLVVTADVDGTNGVTVSGSGPYPVGTAVDAGATSNINSLLAQQALGGVPSDVIVSLHPNVSNQFLAALTDHLNGGLGTTTISDAIEATLVDPTLGTCYDPGDWTTRLAAQGPPHLAPTGTGGAPQLQLSQMTLQFRNAGCNPGDPRVATFTGSMSGISVTSTGSPLGPRASAPTAAWSATRTQADAATAARVPPATASTLLPWAKNALATFLAILVPDHVDLAPGGFPGHGAVHCTTCGRYSGDQRITETFHIS